MIDQPPTRSDRSIAVGSFARARITGYLYLQAEKGRQKYGTDLTTFNGRDVFADAWEELADLVHYLAQAELEMQVLREEIEELKARVENSSHANT